MCTADLHLRQGPEEKEQIITSVPASLADEMSSSLPELAALTILIASRTTLDMSTMLSCHTRSTACYVHPETEPRSSPIPTEVAMDDAGLVQGSEGPSQLQGGFHGLLRSRKVPGLGGIPQAAPRAPLQRHPSLHHWLAWTPDGVLRTCLIWSHKV